LVLFTLEDFIHVKKLFRGNHHHRRTLRGRYNVGAIRHSVGQKVAGRYEPVEVLQSGHLSDGSAGVPKALDRLDSLGPNATN
jgi:hypothetical protein